MNLCRRLTCCIVLAGLAAASPACANPSGGVVVAGVAGISAAGDTLSVTQSSSRAVIDWSGFDIAAGETTQFIQPGASSVTLNRVVNGTQASLINGNLLANGHVLVINPNGVLIGPQGNVDVAGFIATTADIGNNDFMTGAGRLDFTHAGSANAVVENQGHITVHDEGLGLLVAPEVRNSGVIEGNLARIQLGAGDVFGVDLYGDGLLQLAVSDTHAPRTLKAQNTGSLIANAGKVLMTAAAANDVVNTVINTSGVVEAKGLVARGGEVILTGAGAAVSVSGTVNASGKTGGGTVNIGAVSTLDGAEAKTVDIAAGSIISADAIESGDGGHIAVWSQQATTAAGSFYARGGAAGGNGGFVETSAVETLDIAGSYVDTSAPQGSFGTWLMDPTVFVLTPDMAQSINSSSSNYSISSSGPVTFAADINMTASGVGLEIDAGGISISNHYIRTNGGAVTLNATGAMTIDNSTVYTRGGDISLTGQSISGSDAAFSTGGGAFTARLTSGATPALTGMTVDTAAISSISDPVPPLPLIITADAQTKIYGYADPTLTYTISPDVLKAGDTLTGTLAREAGENTGIYGITLGTLAVYATSGYVYAITFKGNDFVITPAMLTITAQDQSKTYGATPALGTADFTVDGLKFSDSVDTVNLASTGAAGSAGVGDYAIDASGAAGTGLSNYTITYRAGNLHVAPAALLVTAKDVTKVYGDTYAFGDGDYTVTGDLYNGDAVSQVSLSSKGALASTVVGDYTVTASHASGTGLSNYIITYAQGSLHVSPAMLTITAQDETKTYGSDFSFTGDEFDVKGLLNKDTVTGVTLSSIGAVATTDVGDYAATAAAATGSGLGNYTINYVDGAFHVIPAALVIAATNAVKTYGVTADLGTTGFTTSTLYNGDSVASVHLGSTGAAGSAAVGKYDITAEGASGKGLSNYDIRYVPGLLTVNPAVLTVTAGNVSKTYGTAYTFTGDDYAVTGLYNNDQVTGVTLASKGAAASATVGGYGMTASSAQGSGLANYTVNYVDGSFTVAPATLTITAASLSKNYGDSLTFTGSEFSTTALYNGDTVARVTLASAGAGADAAAADYAVTAAGASGTGLSNYSINYADGILHVSGTAPPPVITPPPSLPQVDPPPATQEAAGYTPYEYFTAGIKTPPPQPALSLLAQTPAALQMIEPAAGGDAAGHGEEAIACANDFLNNTPCSVR